ncbi:unnamed protein product [Arctia plantaginis]|uniref:Reverse transcriptase domain-containing protein n=1 Tax=Arctia plantaginis TaxID=874455 RepID=A0A8S1A1C1_ARCPL|nr:unnamed protein product [Arctia plantaginis]
MDILATTHDLKYFKDFWKNVNKLNGKPRLPVSVNGVSEPRAIAEMFKDHFRVPSQPLIPGEVAETGAQRNGDTDIPLIHITAIEVAKVIRHMTRGKSPGHDGLSIEHLKYAGAHLPDVLALLFNLCIRHSYLPPDLIKTIVVPIVKNKTGDPSDKTNYRPISLATITAKVLDGVLDRRLDEHITLHDAQFGFQKGLSTESAILALKHTIRYYTDRSTPVYACFLDLSKAFDLVSYPMLWDKLDRVGVPIELKGIFRHWYENQDNCVRWGDECSAEYRLECGVRQGGLTSPRLFNLYVDGLIRELSSMHAGCSIDGVNVNNISYADDMVLLSPSISALRRLLLVCESYALAHVLKYNCKKSEFMVFTATNNYPRVVPPVKLNGTTLSRVRQYKYLGHIVTEDLKDDQDIERERRALAVRSNMIARRFARASEQVKITLFKAFCQSFYSGSLWVKYTRTAYSTLRVQYNNAFRMLMRLPWHCSASGMFAEARVNDFYAIMRKKVASLMNRVCGSCNSILRAVGESYECPISHHWTTVLVGLG